MPRVGSLEANDEIENWKMRHLGIIWVTRKLLPFDVTHPSEIQRLLEKKMYMVFLAKYQLFNISIAKIY